MIPDDLCLHNGLLGAATVDVNFGIKGTMFSLMEIFIGRKVPRKLNVTNIEKAYS